MTADFPFYLGSSVRAMDPQGRIAMPAEWTDLLQRESLYAGLWFDGIIAVRGESQLRQLASQVQQLAEVSAEYSRVRRYLASNINPVELDNQQRLLLGKALRLHLVNNLEAEDQSGQHRVRLVGCFGYFEICLQSAWQKLRTDAQSAAANFSIDNVLNPSRQVEKPRLAAVS